MHWPLSHWNQPDERSVGQGDEAAKKTELLQVGP